MPYSRHMFGLGLSEILVLAVIGLLVIGPDELPQLARSIGRLINDIKRSADDFSDEMKDQIKLDLDENTKAFASRREGDAPAPIAKAPMAEASQEQEEQMELFASSSETNEKKENSQT